MKRNSLFLFVLACLTACNTTPETTTPVVPAERVAAFEATKPARPNGQVKWKADANTAKNVSLLQQKAASLHRGNIKTIADYQHIGNKLQTGIDQLVKECRMQGADHDALHLWLEPLMADVKALKEVTAPDSGDRLFYSIRTRLADYDLYFQQP